MRASRALLLVALDAQLMAVDLGSLACAWSVVTLPRPWLAGAPESNAPAPLALGARWLAYAANQARSLCATSLRPLRAGHRRTAQRPRARRCVGRLALLCSRAEQGEMARCRV